MWLTAESLGLGVQITSLFSSEGVEDELRGLRSIPQNTRFAFGCRLGYLAVPAGRYLRVRGAVSRFTHRNSFVAHDG